VCENFTITFPAVAQKWQTILRDTFCRTL